MTAARVVQSNVSDQRNKIIAGAAGVLIAGGVLYFELSDPSPKAPAPQAAAVTPIVTPANPSPRVTANAVKSGTLVTEPPGNAAGSAARTIGTTSAALDPTLHMQAMLVTESVVYNGSGRNIFAAPGTVPVTPLSAIPKPIAPVRTSTGPPVAVQPSGPPPPPPIDLKFFGTSTNQAGRRQAFLLHGDDVFLAADGDIVQRKYKVITVGPRSVQIEDLTNNNKQTLPLLTSPSSTP